MTILIFFRFAQNEDAVGDLSIQTHSNTGSKMYPSQHQPYLMSQGKIHIKKYK